MSTVAVLCERPGGFQHDRRSEPVIGSPWPIGDRIVVSYEGNCAWFVASARRDDVHDVCGDAEVVPTTFSLQRFDREPVRSQAPDEIRSGIGVLLAADGPTSDRSGQHVEVRACIRQREGRRRSRASCQEQEQQRDRRSRNRLTVT